MLIGCILLFGSAGNFSPADSKSGAPVQFDALPEQSSCALAFSRTNSMTKMFAAALASALLLCQAGGAWAQAGNSGDGRDRSVRINNNTRYTIDAVYAVPSYQPVELISRNLIAYTIEPGSYIVVNLDLGDRACLLDLRVRASNRVFWTRRNHNVCRNHTVNLGN
jgi:hypothetical protein